MTTVSFSIRSLRLSFLLLLPGLLVGAVNCPAIFSDHMVLQSNEPVRIFGTADAGESVTVLFSDQQVQTTTDQSGKWAITLAPLEVSWTPRMLSIQASNTLVYEDVLVGEVWLCSGQSNMEKQIGPRPKQQPTDNWEYDLANSEIAGLRIFQMPRRGKLKPPASGLCWLPSTPENMKTSEFSAVAWYFGRELQRTLKRPVGLIHASFGGSRIEVWTPKAAFQRFPSLAGFAEAQENEKVEGIVPASLYESMIAPLAPYSIKGFLWYQGESNCLNGDSSNYTDKMKALISAWREVWQVPEAPFYYVYLAPWHYTRYENKRIKLTPEALPCLWEAQVAALDIPHTGLVPCSDLSPDLTDIHPTNKSGVGLRLAKLALSDTYGLTFGQVAPPRLETFSIQGNKVSVKLHNADSGLRTRDGAPPALFSLAGSDQVFYPATATIEGATVVLEAPEVPVPVAARHAFREDAFPNLVNASGLPCLAFRTDAWPVLVQRPCEPESASIDKPTATPEAPVKKPSYK